MCVIFYRLLFVLRRCGTTSYEVWDASTDELPDRMILQFDSFTGSDKATSRGFKLSVRSIGTGLFVQFSLSHLKYKIT